MSPWIFLLFIGVFDFGFYAYAAISVENAARVAAFYTSWSSSTAGDSAGACRYAIQELKSTPNARTMSSCAASAGAVTQTTPIAVVAQPVTGPDGQPATQVSVTYQTVPLFPIPGLMGQMTLTRTVTMRLKS